MSKWRKVRLGDIATYINGFAFKPSDWDTKGVPIIRIQNLTGSSNDVNYYNKHYDSKYEVNTGDVLISWSASLGVYKWNQGKAILNQHIFKVVFDKLPVNKDYFVFAVQFLLSSLANQTHGSTMKHITKQRFDNAVIPYPPIETQKQIAKTLNTVSELLYVRKQQLSELDNLIESVFYDMFGDPIKNDKGWKRKELSSCCYVNPKKTEINYFTDDLEVSFIPMASVSTNGEINTKEIRYYREVKTGFTYFYENDVLFAKITPCMENGKGAIARNLKNNIGFGSTEFHVLRPRKGISNSEWLYHLTALPVFRSSAEKYMTGSAGQKRVPASFFDKFLVPLPPLSLQDEFANIIRQIEEQKSLVKKAIEETQLLFDSLMSQYFDE